MDEGQRDSLAAAFARPGDAIVFEADSKRVVFSAILMWLMPILAMIVGYFAGELIGEGVVPIIAAFVFLGLSLFALKLIDTAVAGGSAFYPIITGVIDNQDAASFHCG